MNYILFPILLLSFFSCSETKNINELPTEITLQLNEKTTLLNTTLHFKEVLEDSRCPKYTNCIWEGRAMLQFEITSKKGASELKTIYVGETRKNENKSLIVYQTATYAYFVDAVLPSPENGVVISGYTVTLKKQTL